MGDDWNTNRDAFLGRPTSRDEIADELERQARETMRAIRESAGDLGAHVRQVMRRASELWDEAAVEAPPETEDGDLKPEDVLRARTLATRWVRKDVLVDPELPESMHVVALRDAAAWRIELRERGETRRLEEGSEPYTGTQPPAPGPILPVWEYDFPATPDIESGERRERVAGTELLGACLVCNGTGHKSCTACDGKGFVRCPECRGNAKVPCKRCRGRGRIADSAAERKARASRGYFQVHAERLATDAAERLADFSERLRQDYGVPLPPSGQWAPLAPASGETIPCPDCTDGKVACGCGNGKRVCETCRGSGLAECAACSGSGRVIRFREVVRRFDTRTVDRVVEPAGVAWFKPEMLKRAHGETAWEGNLAELGQNHRPAEVPADVWARAREMVAVAGTALEKPGADAGERRVLWRRVEVTRVPLTQVEYSYGGHPFTFVAAGANGSARFWADEFPPRWHRVGRFFKALLRDLNSDRPSEPRGNGDVTDLEHYRTHRVRIIPDDVSPQGNDNVAPPPLDPEHDE